MTTKRMTYRAALAWLLANDDCLWLNEFDAVRVRPSISACLLCDIYGQPLVKVVSDLRKLQARGFD